MSSIRGKLENANKVKKIQKLDARIVDDGQSVITKAFGLTKCLKPEDDFPHPRHLCFAYPFGRSSPKRHCTKCYCFVCEKVAPCKYWKKRTKRHCDATEKDEKWIQERKLNKKLPGSTTMIFHQLTVSASYHLPDGSELPHRAFSGGLICNKDGKWIIGISMRHYNNFVVTCDITIPFYTALLGGLQLAWSEGFRSLEVKLGYALQFYFWSDFTKDAMTRKFHQCENPSNPASVILKEVENYLNQEWFIEVKNTESYGEEAGALNVASFADYQEQARKVYDFRKHPFFTEDITETITREFTDAAREMAGRVLCSSDHDVSAEAKKYFGLN